MKRELYWQSKGIDTIRIYEDIFWLKKVGGLMSQKTILFGASKLGTLAYEYLKDRYDICYYCDNDIRKIGTSFNGLETISVEMLIDLVTNQDYSVIITSQYYKEISNQLISQGIDKKKIKVFYNSLEYLQTIYDIEEKKEDIKNSVHYSDIEYNNNIFSKYNVHLMLDSIYSKTFIDNVNKENDGKRNLFFILSNSLKLNQSADVDVYNNVEVVDVKDYSIYSKLYTYIYGCNKLFIHFLSDDVCDILDKFNIYDMHCEKNWILWGADLYNYIDFNIYEEKTFEFIKDKDYFINTQKYRNDSDKLNIRRKVIKNIDNILISNKADYDFVIKNFDTLAKRMDFAYSLNIDFDLFEGISRNKVSNLKDEYKVETLFFLGNSATWENNHIDIFYKLKDIQLENFGLILPLSYGNENYAKDLITEAKRIIGDKIIVLDEFLTTTKYYEIMNQADIVIMNHIRQQGVGNTLGAIYLGKQVYMNEKSNIYSILIERNIDVKRIEDLKYESLFMNDNKNNEENREKIRNIYNVDYKEILI